MSNRYQTPNSLIIGASNAVNDFGVNLSVGARAEIVIVIAIVVHLRDFLSQKLTPDLMEDPKIRELWTRLTGERL